MTSQVISAVVSELVVGMKMQTARDSVAIEEVQSRGLKSPPGRKGLANRGGKQI